MYFDFGFDTDIMSPSGSLPGGWFVSDSARRDVALKSRWQTRAVENSRFHACQSFGLLTVGFEPVFSFSAKSIWLGLAGTSADPLCV